MRSATSEVQDLLAPAIGAPEDTVWLADVDDTLVDTVRMHSNAASVVARALQADIGEPRAKGVADRFAEIFSELLGSHQAKTSSSHDAVGQLEARVAGYQVEVAQQYGMIKKFSREVLLALAADDCGVALTADQIASCADQYWQHLDANTIVFPDALRLCEALARANAPLYLFTSSDARLVLKANGQFHYDPQRSRSFKATRMDNLRKRGVQYRDVFIGDPIDKPSPAFFEMIYKGIEKDLQKKLDPKHVIVMGDSYRSDVQVPLATNGAAVGVLYKNGREEVTVETGERLVSIGSWDVITDLLSGRQARPD